MRTRRSRPAEETRSTSSATFDVFASADIVSHVLSHLPAPEFARAANVCTLFREITLTDKICLSRVSIGLEEPPEWHPTRQAFLQRLADAGNAHACYRLGLAFAYHPQEPRHPLADALKLLHRALELGDEETRADTAYELWLLTRRLAQPGSAHSPGAASAGSSSSSSDDAPLYTPEDVEGFLEVALASDHRPARFAAHRSRSRRAVPGDFDVSRHFQAAQLFLVAAQADEPLTASRFSVCQNPLCGRWGVRAREVRRRCAQELPALQAPPGLPRCQGIFGLHCRTRYCSRYCQALDWPTHREECGTVIHAGGGALDA